MKKNISNYDRMTKTPVARLIVSLGIPTTISMLVTNIYNMADTYFVGSLGESAQGAMGILFTLQTIIQAIAFMLGHGSGTFVSKELADQNPRRASTYVSTAFFTGSALGTLLMIFGLIFIEPFVRLLGSTETILPYAKDYGMWVLIACPFMVMSFILNNNLRYEGKAVYAMVGLTSGGILNIFLDYVFVKILNLGVYGAGMATAISQVVSFTILIVMFVTKAESKLSLRYISRDVKVYFSIVKVGLPSLIRQGLTSISNGILNNLIKPFGDAAIAAMSIVNRYSSFIMCFALGIGQGFQPFAAFNYQTKNYARVKKGLYFTMLMGLAFVGVLSVVGFVFADDVVWVFQKAQDVIDVGAPAVRYASVGILLSPFFVPISMLFQSTRNAKTASFLALLRSGLILLPVLFVASSIGGLKEIQLSQPISDVLTGLISLPFLIKFNKDHQS